MKTICTDCEHQAACGHAEVEACGSFAAPHWSDAMPMIERTVDADGTAAYRSEIEALPCTPGCSCRALRQAREDAAAKGREIARLDAIVEEGQAPERTCRLIETGDTDGHGNVYGKSIRCSACNKPLKKNLVNGWTGIKFCYHCGAKVVAL